MELKFLGICICTLGFFAFVVWGCIDSWKRKRFKKFIISTLIVSIITIVGVVSLLALPWILIFVGIQLMPAPPRPVITYGEFPFRLEYEIYGRRYVIKDTLICEYAGIGSNEGIGKYNKWEGRLLSGSERVTLLKLNNDMEICYPIRSAEYYMGDLESGVSYNRDFSNASLFTKFKGGHEARLIEADELFTKYRIKIISWEYTKPIVQRYKK